MKKTPFIVTLSSFLLNIISPVSAQISVIGADYDVMPAYYYEQNYNGKKNIDIYLIEDLHANLSAQKSISRIMEFLDKNSDITAILMEGTAKTVNPSVFSYGKIPNKNRFLDYLLDSSLINGVEYYALKNDKESKISGLEDKTLYDENINKLKLIFDSKREVNKYLSEMQKDLSQIQNDLYSPENKEILKMQKKHAASAVTDLKYFGFLLDNAGHIADKPLYIEEDCYALSGYISMQKGFGKINYKKLNEEINNFFIAAKEVFPYAVYKDLADSFNKYDNPLIFCSILSNIINDNNLRGYGEIKKIGAFYSVKSDTDYKILLKAQKRIEKFIFLSHALSPEEKRLIILSDAFDKYKSYYGASATEYDYEFIKGFGVGGFEEEWLKTVNKKAVFIDKKFALLYKNYYDNNIARNNVFMKNILDALKSRDGEGSLAMLCGGFHSGVMKEFFEENGISYCIITPDVNEYSGEDRTVYEKLISENGGISGSAIPPKVFIGKDHSLQILDILSSVYNKTPDKQTALKSISDAAKELNAGNIEITPFADSGGTPYVSLEYPDGYGVTFNIESRRIVNPEDLNINRINADIKEKIELKRVKRIIESLKNNIYFQQSFYQNSLNTFLEDIGSAQSRQYSPYEIFKIILFMVQSATYIAPAKLNNIRGPLQNVRNSYERSYIDYTAEEALIGDKLNYLLSESHGATGHCNVSLFKNKAGMFASFILKSDAASSKIRIFSDVNYDIFSGNLGIAREEKHEDADIIIKSAQPSQEHITEQLKLYKDSNAKIIFIDVASGEGEIGAFSAKFRDFLSSYDKRVFIVLGLDSVKSLFADISKVLPDTPCIVVSNKPIARNKNGLFIDQRYGFKISYFVKNAVVMIFSRINGFDNKISGFAGKIANVKKATGLRVSDNTMRNVNGLIKNFEDIIDNAGNENKPLTEILSGSILPYLKDISVKIDKNALTKEEFLSFQDDYRVLASFKNIINADLFFDNADYDSRLKDTENRYLNLGILNNAGFLNAEAMIFPSATSASNTFLAYIAGLQKDVNIYVPQNAYYEFSAIINFDNILNRNSFKKTVTRFSDKPGILDAKTVNAMFFEPIENRPDMRMEDIRSFFRENINNKSFKEDVYIFIDNTLSPFMSADDFTEGVKPDKNVHIVFYCSLHKLHQNGLELASAGGVILLSENKDKNLQFYNSLAFLRKNLGYMPDKYAITVTESMLNDGNMPEMIRSKLSNTSNLIAGITNALERSGVVSGEIISFPTVAQHPSYQMFKNEVSLNPLFGAPFFFIKTNRSYIRFIEKDLKTLLESSGIYAFNLRNSFGFNDLTMVRVGDSVRVSVGLHNELTLDCIKDVFAAYAELLYIANSGQAYDEKYDTVKRLTSLVINNDAITDLDITSHILLKNINYSEKELNRDSLSEKEKTFYGALFAVSYVMLYAQNNVSFAEATNVSIETLKPSRRAAFYNILDELIESNEIDALKMTASVIETFKGKSSMKKFLGTLSKRFAASNEFINSLDLSDFDDIETANASYTINKKLSAWVENENTEGGNAAGALVTVLTAPADIRQNTITNSVLENTATVNGILTSS
ncbi:MAG: hypothetical protein LBR69_07370 [Endomicrobium sp.]|jgi:hypothetical protein|nr:hypothetical protein [Endomicrobium sp.]